MLRLAEGEHAGKPFELRLWQQFIIGSLFGWLGPDGYRRYRSGYVEIGKGNGKSPMAGGTGLYMMEADGEIGAHCFAAATTREQAGILFQDAVKMVEASPALKARITLSGKAHVFNLADLATGSFFRPISSDGKGLDGKRVHYAALDEVHEHPNAVVVNKMRAGRKGRRQPLIFEITNSGFDRTSVCWQHHDYSEKVLRGIMTDDSWFAFVCQLDPCAKCAAEGKTQPTEGCKDCDDWRDPRVWLKVNPNLGVSVTEKYLREQVTEAMAIPSQENTVKRLNFCIWTEQASRWMPMDAWDACNERFDVEDLIGRECICGLDLGSTNDFNSFVKVFPPIDELPFWVALWRFWIPEARFEERVRKDPGHSFAEWKRQGWLETTPGNVTDYQFIRSAIHDDAEKYVIKEIAYDRWNACQLVTDLGNDGLTMVPFGQGFQSMNAPLKEILRLVLGRELSHGGNPVARWQASNVVVKLDPAGNIKLDKERSPEKIDGMAALADAMGRAIVRDTDGAGYTSPEVFCV